jgi:DNA-binding transcriptional ArsR family regulator
MKSSNVLKQITNILKVLGSAFRIKLLYCIGTGEACVCHLEAVMKKRQAYISQHLMVLRDAGILETRRDGKYIFYRVADESIFDLIESAAAIQGFPPEKLSQVTAFVSHADCSCPNCVPDFAKEIISEQT